MGIRAVPPLFLLISFSLIGMAYVRVGVKITRIWWVMISVGWGTWLGNEKDGFTPDPVPVLSTTDPGVLWSQLQITIAEFESRVVNQCCGDRHGG